jgi:hypothetical protein
MKSLFIGLAALIGMSFVAAPAEAKPNKAKVFIVEPAPNQAPVEAKVKGQHPHKKHQGAKQNQLQQAIKDGRITKPEAKRLKLQKQQLRHMKQVALADGVITPREHRKISKAQQNFKKNKQQAIQNQNIR